MPITNDDQDNEARTILGWLSSKNFWLQQADVSSQRQPGTGQWILQRSDFLEWAGGKRNTIWCLGGRKSRPMSQLPAFDYAETNRTLAGVGKTILA